MNKLRPAMPPAMRALALLRRVVWLSLVLSSLLMAIHFARYGQWHAWRDDALWGLLAAVLVVAGQRWHAGRGQACSLCVVASEEVKPNR